MEKPLYDQQYQNWLNSTIIDETSKNELRAIEGDKNEIEDRFYQDLEFGTAGLRGKMGAGTNRMNQYIIARATDAFAKVIKSFGDEFASRGLVIAYDCRLFSKEFSLTAALVLASHGIKAYLFDALRPTPELSFAIRKLGAAGGINVTASHNPKNYNGYKVYWQEGSQIKDDIADMILAEIKKITNFEDIKFLAQKEKYTQQYALENGLLEYIGSQIDDEFIAKAKAQSLNDDSLNKNIKIVYTPLNGAGNILVRRILAERGFENVYVVKEQELPDGNFPTVEYPNPEDVRAFEYSIKLGKEKYADLLIATDPDCDRVAIMVKYQGKYQEINGNQAGVLLIHYILSQMDSKNLIKPNSIIVKSIVTAEMGTLIAQKYGVEMVNVLTGFKNIFAVQNELDKTKDKTMIMGYEESIGYAVGTFVRDKDAVTSAMLFAEAAAFYSAEGKTLVDVLDDLYQEFGYHKEDTVSLVMEGITGQQKIAKIMEEYRSAYPKQIADMKLSKYIDYRLQEELDIGSEHISKIDIEKQNAMKFQFECGSWYALRPSGTEPKIKIYACTRADTKEKAEEKLAILKETVLAELKKI
ncbi:phospho-sugar mutase [Proteocatella sphenisci]|uniref:phospho-sugar mutase n=1 Tax=Proteocatella sphenisci TaxID=181070 RepID=UPI00048C5936|nr:phospho-sugar mutase [Proteocatella sphenisci]